VRKTSHFKGPFEGLVKRLLHRWSGIYTSRDSSWNTDLLLSQGMLASAATIEIVVERLEEYDVKIIVLDPVCHQSAEIAMPSLQRELMICHR
jgi:Phosphomethylpyrimidine kinase